MPSADVAAEAAQLVDVLGGELVFAIEAMGTRVAMVQMASEPSPPLLLAGHLEGEPPVLVYRGRRLDAATGELRARGFDRGRRSASRTAPAGRSRRPGVTASRCTSSRAPTCRSASPAGATSDARPILCARAGRRGDEARPPAARRRGRGRGGARAAAAGRADARDAALLPAPVGPAVDPPRARSADPAAPLAARPDPGVPRRAPGGRAGADRHGPAEGGRR